jgi:TPR repeat protein
MNKNHMPKLFGATLFNPGVWLAGLILTFCMAAQAVPFTGEISFEGELFADAVDYQLGMRHLTGRGAEQDYTKAAERFTKDVKMMRHAQAQYQLGLLYYTGDGVARDYRLAAELIQKSAEQGYPKAQSHLKISTLEELHSTLEALIIHANGGDPIAQTYLGEKYYHEIKDYIQAAYWYSKATKSGNAAAQNNLGLLYQNGYGVEKSYSKAAALFQLAANQGLHQAQFNLGFHYYQGLGIPQSYPAAAAWFQKSADQGNANAQRNLGVLYAKGQGVAQSYANAAAWYKKSADQGNAEAQNYLGGLYDNGRGVLQSFSTAAAWYKKAADQGDANAQNNLGVSYANGQGVAQSYSIASQWFQKSADQGNAEAQNHLGVLYANGLGLAQSYANAAAWYQKSANGGSKNGAQNLAATNQIPASQPTRLEPIYLEPKNTSVISRAEKSPTFTEVVVGIGAIVVAAAAINSMAGLSSNEKASNTNDDIDSNTAKKTKCRSEAKQRLALCETEIRNCDMLDCYIQATCSYSDSSYARRCENKLSGRGKFLGSRYCDGVSGEVYGKGRSKDQVLNEICSE